MKIYSIATRLVIAAFIVTTFSTAHAEDDKWEGIKKRIEGAVERGDLTREEADRKYVEIKKDMAQKKGGESKEQADPRKQKYMQAEKEIKEMVKAGKVSEADAKRRLVEMKKHLWGNKQDHDRKKGAAPSKEQLYKEAERGIKAAFELGKISEEEAKQKIEDLHREVNDAKQRAREKELHETMERGIRAMVALGKIDEAEARDLLNKKPNDKPKTGSH